jgi:hypothetical protein
MMITSCKLHLTLGVIGGFVLRQLCALTINAASKSYSSLTDLVAAFLFNLAECLFGNAL